MAYRLIISLLLLLLPLTAHSQPEAIHIKGSTTIAPVMKQLITAYRLTTPTQPFSMTSTGSGDGAQDLLHGTAEIAMMSRTMTDLELRKSSKAGFEPYQTDIGMDGLIPIVHPDNPVTNLSQEQLHRIFSGQITNWNEVGGSNAPIVAYSRTTHSGSHDIWIVKVLEGTKESPSNILVQSNEEMRSAISRDRNAIGYVGLGFIDPEIKQLALDGIMGGLETIRDGSYPIRRPLCLYTADKPTSNVQHFLDFVLGPVGQKIIERAGFSPVH